MPTPFPRPPRTDRAARIKALHAIARRHGGRCRTREYLGLRQLLDLECAEGHRFAITPEKVFEGYWCGTCLRRGPAKLAEVEEYAQSLGGECLSPTYRPGRELMRFRCKQGHVWDTSIDQIRRGSWCPRCAGKGTTITDMQAIAAKRGGRCLSRRYVGQRGPLRWRCAAGHDFRMLPVSVMKGGWCPTCYRNHPTIRRPAASIETAIKMAAKRGGLLLSRRTTRVAHPMLWRCAAGHEFSAPANSVLKGRWCAACLCLTIEEMQEIAQIRGGRCLSPEYVNSATKLLWECDRGHRWWASPSNVKYRGSWCRQCADAARRGHAKDRR